MFIAVSFMIAKTWKQPRCFLVGDCINPNTSRQLNIIQHPPPQKKSLGGWSGEVAGSGIRQVGTCQITEGLINAVYQFGLSSEGNGEAWTGL